MGWLQNASQGLGRVRNALLPVPEEVASQLDPQTIETLRKQAMLQMGLGMMSAGEKGQGIGTGALYGLNQAQQGLGQGLNQAWVGSRAKREDERVRQYDRRLDLQEAKAEEDRKWQREKFQETMDFNKAQAEAQAARAEADDARQAAQLAVSQGHLGLAQNQASLGAAAQRAEMLDKRAKALADRAVMTAGMALAKNPKDEKAKAIYKTFSGREWDPKTGQSALQQLIEETGGLDPAQAGPVSPPGSIPVVTNPADVAKLPSGTVFKTPDGRLKRAP